MTTTKTIEHKIYYVDSNAIQHVLITTDKIEYINNKASQVIATNTIDLII